LIRLGIDIDGVICDFSREVSKMANRLFNKQLPLGYLPKNWNWSDVLTAEEWKAIWKELMATEDFWLHLIELPGARELHSFLAKNNDTQVYFITSRAQSVGQSTLMQTTQWLERRGLWPRFDRSTVIVTEASEKWKYLKALEIPWYLDDYLPTIVQVQSICEGTRGVVFDAPYNQDGRGIPRFYSVAAYLQQVKDSQK